jgi:Rod binding domain-containing protein
MDVSAVQARARLHEQAVAFEGLFLGILMRTMRQGIQESGRFHGGRGEAVFRGVLDGEVAGRMAERSGLGIAEMLEQSLGSRLDRRA